MGNSGSKPTVTAQQNACINARGLMRPVRGDETAGAAVRSPLSAAPVREGPEAARSHQSAAPVATSPCQPRAEERGDEALNVDAVTLSSAAPARVADVGAARLSQSAAPVARSIGPSGQPAAALEAPVLGVPPSRTVERAGSAARYPPSPSLPQGSERPLTRCARIHTLHPHPRAPGGQNHEMYISRVI